MKSQIIEQYRKSFEQCARQYKGVECWSARDLQSLMGYEEWRNFVSIIEKAVESCQNSKQEPKYHFVEVNKLIETGK